MILTEKQAILLLQVLAGSIYPDNTISCAISPEDRRDLYSVILNQQSNTMHELEKQGHIIRENNDCRHEFEDIPYNGPKDAAIVLTKKCTKCGIELIR